VNNCKYESLATKIIAMTESARMIFRYCDFICAFLFFRRTYATSMSKKIRIGLYTFFSFRLFA
jgi:uncharacterized protein YutD